jgi:hypothetical protein
MILVKGDDLSFDDEKGKEIVLPPNFVVLQDIDRSVMRECDFLCVPVEFVSHGLSSSDLKSRQAAIEYYGKKAKFCKVSFVLPDEDQWRPVSMIKQIRYRRTGHLGKLFKHDYSEPQPLYKSTGPSGYKISSPDWCLANWRGIVRP